MRIEKDQESDILKIRGRIEAIRHRNDDTGFTVFAVKNSLTKEIYNCSGVSGPMKVGETANLEGKLVNHPKFGQQIKVRGVTITPPESVKDIENYLSSGFMKGIGPETARQIVKKFGADSLVIINEFPEKIRTVKGIGKKRADLILSAWETHREIQAIMQFLKERNIGAQRAYSIYKAYQDKPGGAFRVLSENPYQLTSDVRGIGFKLADQIAATLNFEKDDPRRLRAGVSHVLETETSKGHCGLPLRIFIDKASELLEAPRAAVERIVQEELDANRIIGDTIGTTYCAFTRRMHEAEGYIAERLKMMKTAPTPWSAQNIAAAIKAVEARTKRNLSDSQREAITVAMENKVTIITGGPGVGKTTTLDTLLRVLSNHLAPETIKLGAPTGKAAKRMSEQTGLVAMTVHRLISFGQKDNEPDEDSDAIDAEQEPKRKKEDYLAGAKLLVLDEASMLDVRLFHSFLDKITKGGKAPHSEIPALILVGDVDQIPSVGAGAVLRDAIESNSIAVARLNQVFRQAASSRIITNAHRINRGALPENLPNGEKSDFYLWPFEAPSEKHGRMTLTQAMASELVEIATKRMPASLGLNPLTDIQILAPMHSGDLGTGALNKALQAALNPPRPSAPTVTWNDWEFRIGDKCMQRSNNYDKNVFNGEGGFVQDIDKEKKTLLMRFEQGIISYTFEELDQLMPSYAITIHKSQGSEYPAVIIPIANAHYMMLARNLLYTGVTRGKTMVIVIGQKDAVRRAVQNDQPNRRWTRLRDLMEDPNYRHYVPRVETPLARMPPRQAQLSLENRAGA
jgi:exodeoxyribonuclease V alpha subunit